MSTCPGRLRGRPGSPPVTSVIQRTPRRPSSAGELAPHGLDGVEGDLRAADLVVAHRVAGAAEDEDHAGSPLRPCGGAAARAVRNAVRTATSRGRGSLDVHVQHRGAVRVRVRDDVHRDVDRRRRCAATASACSRPPPRRARRRPRSRRSRRPPVGDRVERRLGAAGEEHVRPLAGERAGHRAADRAAPAVHDRRLSLEHLHALPASRFGCHRGRRITSPGFDILAEATLGGSRNGTGSTRRRFAEAGGAALAAAYTIGGRRPARAADRANQDTGRR